MIFNIEQIILTFGYAGLFSIIFSETGLLIGFFLPGDTLLFTAGVLAAQGFIGFWEVLAICSVAAIIGDSFGYYLGKTYGKAVFEQKHHFLDEYLNKKNLKRTHDLYCKYGNAIIFVARFIPVIRTIAPTFAGVAEMKYRSFLFYNVFGATAWVVSIVTAGFVLGNVVPGMLDIATLAIIVVVTLTISPVLIKAIKHRIKKRG